jgi:hypothetical protein
MKALAVATFFLRGVEGISSAFLLGGMDFFSLNQCVVGMLSSR